MQRSLLEWRGDVMELRSFMDEDYTIRMGNRVFSVDGAFRHSQLAWGRIGVQKFAERVIPLINGTPSLEHNDFINAVGQAVRDALTFGNSTILISTSDGSIRVSAPETAKAEIDPFGNISFYEDLGSISSASIGQGGQLYTASGSMPPEQIYQSGTPSGIFAYSLFYNADAAHPYGQSRLTPAVRNSIRAASRSKAAMELAENFYAYPQRYILNGWDTLNQAVKEIPMGPSTITSIPQNQSANSNVTAGQWTPSDFTPYLGVQERLAEEVAAALDLDAADLGVHADATAPSSDAIFAGKEKLSISIERWEREITSILQSALGEYDFARGIEKGVLSWQRPALPSQASIADAAVKLIGVMPTLADNPAFLRWVGVPDSVIQATVDQNDASTWNPDAGTDSGEEDS